MFSLICGSLNGCVNNRGAGDLRRHRAHYDVIVMVPTYTGGIGSMSNHFCILGFRLDADIEELWFG